jgi:hypothetical protein
MIEALERRAQTGAFREERARWQVAIVEFEFGG